VLSLLFGCDGGYDEFTRADYPHHFFEDGLISHLIFGPPDDDQRPFFAGRHFAPPTDRMNLRAAALTSPELSQAHTI
jgi:hypothetical protein